MEHNNILWKVFSSKHNKLQTNTKSEHIAHCECKVLQFFNANATPAVSGERLQLE